MTTCGRQGTIDDMTTNQTLRIVHAAPSRCALHPAFEADYCPSCGTAQVIGGAR